MTTKKPPAKRDICGKHSGWNAHNRHGESQCDPCRRAKADYMLDYRRRKGFTLATLYTPAEIATIVAAALNAAADDADLFGAYGKTWLRERAASVLKERAGK